MGLEQIQEYDNTSQRYKNTKPGFESNFQTPSYLALQSRLSNASFISLIICGPIVLEAIWTVFPPMFTLMVRSAPG